MILFFNRIENERLKPARGQVLEGGEPFSRLMAQNDSLWSIKDELWRKAPRLNRKLLKEKMILLKIHILFAHMVRPAGFEPADYGLELGFLDYR